MVGARLDYCNTILHGMSKSDIQKLQRALNSIARIVTGTRRSEHITPVLARLHWLKIVERIEFKIAFLTFKALTTGKPDYLSDQLQLCTPVRQLRSSDRKNRLYVNSHRTTFASRASTMLHCRLEKSATPFNRWSLMSCLFSSQLKHTSL